MKLQIPLSEAHNIIKEKTRQDVTLEIKNNNTIKLGYKLKVKVPFFGDVSKNVDCDITVESIDGEILNLRYATAGIGIDMILKGIIAASPTLSSKQVIEPLEGNRLKVNLGKIEKVHEALEKVTIKEICFVNENVEIVFNLK